MFDSGDESRSQRFLPHIGAQEQKSNLFIPQGADVKIPLLTPRRPSRDSDHPVKNTFAGVTSVAPRAYWKGYLKLSLVSCPIALYPATSEREKISFHQLNKDTGNRIKYRKVDAESGEEVEAADIIKGYEVGNGEDPELAPEDPEA